MGNRILNAVHGHLAILADRLPPPDDTRAIQEQRVERVTESATEANGEGSSGLGAAQRVDDKPGNGSNPREPVPTAHSMALRGY